MPARSRRRLWILRAIAVLLAVYWWRSGRKMQLDAIALPPGFHIALYADSVPDARSLALGDSGTVFVGSREGTVHALIDRDRDGRADEVLVIASGLYMPNGVAVRDGALYVAEVGQIIRFDSIEHRLRTPPRPVVVLDGLPLEGMHGWKFIRFGPDGRLYVPVGAPCNICLSDDRRFASILSLTPDGQDLRFVAEGVRNTVGFDWDPATGDLWFTDNGRDWLGEDRPPDELNHVIAPGQHFGYPFCHGGDISDPEFGTQRPCSAFTPPAARLGAHVAALGMRFYTGAMFPPEYRGRIFIAEHGSWNRVIAAGYRMMTVRFAEGKPVYEVFASGWSRLNRAWGRPVDVLQMPDGALLVSDDQAGAVYRITYHN